jgi:hypothetical protein
MPDEPTEERGWKILTFSLFLTGFVHSKIWKFAIPSALSSVPMRKSVSIITLFPASSDPIPPSPFPKKGFSIDPISRVQNPTCFSKITLDMVLKSSNVTDADFEKVIGKSDEKLCPVYAMIKGNVDVVITRTILA